MKSHEFIQAAADLMSALAGEKRESPNRAVLIPVEAEHEDHADPTTMVSPLQQKLELLKKAVDVDSYFDANNPGYDPGPGEGTRSPDELEQMKLLAGLMHNAGDDNDVLDA